LQQEKIEIESNSPAWKKKGGVGLQEKYITSEAQLNSTQSSHIVKESTARRNAGPSLSLMTTES
jgi:hypothetical protein